MNNIIKTNFEHEYKKDKEDKFTVTHIIGTTKQQQLVHINIPFKKVHTEDPVLYNGSTIIVKDGNGVLSIGDDYIFIKQNDIIMVDENRGFRLWSSHSELNIYLLYSTQVYPDNRKNGIRRKYSMNIVSDNTEENNSVSTPCGIFRNCSK